jgi:hypothetical protein
VVVVGIVVVLYMHVEARRRDGEAGGEQRCCFLGGSAAGDASVMPACSNGWVLSLQVGLLVLAWLVGLIVCGCAGCDGIIVCSTHRTQAVSQVGVQR